MTKNDETLERARRQNQLWPTIHDALDTFLRRKARGAEAYELVWRMLHLTEAIDITLASASIARLRTEVNLEPIYLRVREHAYGIKWNAQNGQLEGSLGALGGSIDRWIDILFETAKLSNHDSQFLHAVGAFLNAGEIDLTHLLATCRKACDMGAPEKTAKLNVMDTLRVINTFRNRLAHVPFPHDVVVELSDLLESAVSSILKTRHISGEKDVAAWQGPGGALAGAFADSKTMLRGGNPEQITEKLEGFRLVFRHGEKSLEHWDGSPFMYLDDMERPYVTTRLKNEDSGTWELTRFRAEANAVINIDDPKWLGLLPKPKRGDYELAPEAKSAKPVAIVATKDTPKEAKKTLAQVTPTYGDALEARRNGDFARSSSILKEYTKQHPGYHPGWLNLGISLRESAWRQFEEDGTNPKAGLAEAEIAFMKAAEHVDDSFKASAFYELSKADWKGYCARNPGKLESAERNAERAIKLSPEEKYLSWLDFIGRNSWRYAD